MNRILSLSLVLSLMGLPLLALGAAEQDSSDSPRPYLIPAATPLDASGMTIQQSTPRPLLEPGMTRRGFVLFQEEGESSARFEVFIPDEWFAVEFRILDSRADLDLFLRDQEGTTLAYSEDTRFNERLFVTRRDENPLRAGHFFVDVVYAYTSAPRWEGQDQSRIPFQLEMRPVVMNTATVLEANVVHERQIRTDQAWMDSFLVNAEGLEELRLDIWNNNVDADIYVFQGGLKGDLGQADHRAISLGSRETLELFPRRDGTELYGVMVISQATDMNTPYSFLAQDSHSVPEILLPLPEIPISADTDLNQILSTVEILGPRGGGSGVLISPLGHILTNFHVIEGSWEERDQPVIAFYLEEGRAPVELFKARILEVNEDRDLALLQIVEGYYGQSLPVDLVFPHVPVRPLGNLRLDDELKILGYPAVGSLSSRAPISLSRGRVSGFEWTDKGTLIKTDAFINSGNSGGAALDSRGRLLGLPTLVVSDGRASLSFIVSTDMVPTEWWDLAGVDWNSTRD